MTFFNIQNRDIIIYMRKFMSIIDFVNLLSTNSYLYSLMNDKFRKIYNIESFLKFKKYPYINKIVKGKGKYDWKLYYPQKGEPELSKHFNRECKNITEAFRIMAEYYTGFNSCYVLFVQDLNQIQIKQNIADYLIYLEFDEDIKTFNIIFNGISITYKVEGKKTFVNIPLFILPFVNIEIKPVKAKGYFWIVDGERRKQLQKCHDCLYETHEIQNYYYMGDFVESKNLNENDLIQN